jgi:serine/threonine protein kinase
MSMAEPSDAAERFAELFDEALGIAPALRDEWLSRVCGDDAGLREKLERLLRADARATGILESLPRLVADAAASANPPFELPRSFGPYRVVRSIGVGGMGEVWLAERCDGEYEQRVAIKQLAYPTPGLLQRFRQERQILAHLEHPNIARLLDGGVDARGAPYLVMEYVEGVPITEYVRGHALDLRLRLQLFVRVCDAVQFAHQNLVVHRDLKPSNIFVTADGTPKLLDFGIAKVLSTTADDVPTQTHARLLTPDYAAPEQLNGGIITTATDVYSLGVVLYELLAGTRPPRSLLRASQVDEATSPREPQPPSAALDRSTGPARRRALRGDLDRIALTALAAEPQRRYASAAALAADIRRHLDGRPITARADSAIYRLRKFVRRNRYAVSAALLVALVCIAATVISLRQASRAIEQAHRAEAVRQFLVDIFSQVNPDENHGQPITANLLLKKSEQRLVDAPMPDDLRADLTSLIGTFYWNLADDAAAERALTKAMTLAENRNVPSYLAARNLAALARVEQDMRKFDSAYAHAASAQDLARGAGQDGADAADKATHLLATLSLRRDGPERTVATLRDLLAVDRVRHGDNSEIVVDDLSTLGGVLHELARYDEAEATLQESIARTRALHGFDHTSAGLALDRLGSMRVSRGDYLGADQAYKECLALIERFWGKDSVRSSVVHSQLLGAAVLEGRMEPSIPALLKIQGEARAQQNTRPDNFLWTSAHLGDAYLGLGRLQDAEETYRTMAAASAAETAYLAVALKGVADTLELQGRYAETETAYRDAAAIQQKLGTRSSHGFNGDRAAIGNLLRLQHRFSEAVQEIGEADRALGDEPSSQDPIVATVKAQLAEAQLDAGDAQQAQATAAVALSIARRVLPAHNWQLGTALFALARAEAALGHATVAEPLLREALAVRSPPHPADDLRVLEVKVALANALVNLGDADEARALTAAIEPALRASSSPYATDLRARLASQRINEAKGTTLHTENASTSP